MAWAGALAPGSRGCCSPRSSTSPIASAVRSPSPATVAETAASTGSKTSRAASRRTSLASSSGHGLGDAAGRRRLELVQRRLVVREDLPDRVDVVLHELPLGLGGQRARCPAPPRSPRGRAARGRACPRARAPRARSPIDWMRASRPASVVWSARITRWTAWLPCRRWRRRRYWARLRGSAALERLDGARVQRRRLVRRAPASSAPPGAGLGGRPRSVLVALLRVPGTRAGRIRPRRGRRGSARGSARSRPRA